MKCCVHRIFLEQERLIYIEQEELGALEDLEIVSLSIHRQHVLTWNNWNHNWDFILNICRLKSPIKKVLRPMKDSVLWKKLAIILIWSKLVFQRKRAKLGQTAIIFCCMKTPTIFIGKVIGTDIFYLSGIFGLEKVLLLSNKQCSSTKNIHNSNSSKSRLENVFLFSQCSQHSCRFRLFHGFLNGNFIVS